MSPPVEQSSLAWRHELLVRALIPLRALVRTQRELEEARATHRWAERWQETINAIATSSRYHRSTPMVPQDDLLPLGPDPTTGLHEFAHLPTGEPAVRENGRLRLQQDSGIVFVLLPGGRLPEALDQRLPVHDAQLDPFFIAKWELSERQWMRLSGQWRSDWYVELPDRIQAIEGVSHVEAEAALANAGGWLQLPSGAQWEYACRAGRAGAFWFNATPDLEEANVDGRGGRLPLRHRRANPFGLIDMLGNVEEWCSDGGTDHLPARVGDGRRDGSRNRRWRRGGSYSTLRRDLPIGYTPSASRNDWSTGNSHSDLDRDGDWDFFGEAENTDTAGLRPCRPVMR